MLPNPLLLFAFLLISNLVYGLVLASFLANDRDEILALSLPLSFATFAFSTLPALFLNIDFFPTSQFLALVVLITFSIQAIRTGRIELVLSRLKSLLHGGKSSSVILLGYFFILLHLFSQQALAPFYGLGSLPGDWFGHYRITHEFLTHSISAFPMRLPLYQLLQIFFLSALNPVPSFGHDFYQFQIVQLLVGLSIFTVVHLLFKRLFDSRVSSALTFAAALLPYVVVQALFTWPKMLASMFSLLGFYY
ncbi:hypothetical protein GWN42_10160, partial [candidate division KSB1 bacterium]|nr:hypothetical protein [candidate division KSB1 bacterium]